jgi:hypothetical protein
MLLHLPEGVLDEEHYAGAGAAPRGTPPCAKTGRKTDRSSFRAGKANPGPRLVPPAAESETRSLCSRAPEDLFGPESALGQSKTDEKGGLTRRRAVTDAIFPGIGCSPPAFTNPVLANYYSAYSPTYRATRVLLRVRAQCCRRKPWRLRTTSECCPDNKAGSQCRRSPDSCCA